MIQEEKEGRSSFSGMRKVDRLLSLLSTSIICHHAHHIVSVASGLTVASAQFSVIKRCIAVDGKVTSISSSSSIIQHKQQITSVSQNECHFSVSLADHHHHQQHPPCDLTSSSSPVQPQPPPRLICIIIRSTLPPPPALSTNISLLKESSGGGGDDAIQRDEALCFQRKLCRHYLSLSLSFWFSRASSSHRKRERKKMKRLLSSALLYTAVQVRYK